MTEALISGLLEKLSSVTYQYVEEEVKLVLNAEKDVKEFKAKLKAIRAVLEDAELRQVKEASVRNWLEELTEVSYKMDNVLDEWNTEILKQQIEKQEKHGGSTSLVTEKKKKNAVCFSIPSSCFCFGQVSQIIHRHEFALKIKSLNEDLDVIAKHRGDFQFRKRTIIEQLERDETTSFVDASEVFGREQQKEVLVSKLLNESSQEESGLLVIPIVGMGGMGKTALAQLAFNDVKVKACFDIKVWVCVSDPFDEIKTAKAIISGAKGVSPNSDTLEDLFQCMFESIKGKKFLLVLDDVWTEDQKKWEKLKFPLIQSGARGSRILATTRKQEVAIMMGCTTQIHLERLSEQNCLLIFNRMAFFNRKEEDFGVLGAIGKEIAKKCKGLPLAAKTMGSLMRHKKTKNDWLEVLNSKIWELEEVEEQVFRPLLLSYFDLVPAVKQCLLYCAIFPKDYLIDKDHLIELWMSQDYLYLKGKIEKKIIGQRFFDNLVMRSFFQDFQEDDARNITGCKMHDIVHDFLLFLNQNECFTMEVKGGNDTIEPLCDKLRHLTLVLASKGPLSCVSFSNCKSELRTLATFDSSFTVVDSTLMSQLNYLRTLNLSGNSIEELPEEIGKLVYLRFIDLSENPLKKLPKAVCNLYNLQTLRLDGCEELESLPQSMGMLINLKHLYVEVCFKLRYLPKGIGRLTNLRRLDGCPVGGGKDDDEAFKLGDLRNLDQLQGQLKIEMYGEVKVAAGEGEKASPLGNKQQLSNLSIDFKNREDEEGRSSSSAETLNFLRPHPNLESLYIERYNGSTAPNWIMSLNNLRYLFLWDWNECEVLPPLGKLPSLERLNIWNMKGVKRVGVEFLGIEKETSSASSCITLFPKLKHLEFHYMWAWEEWKGVEESKEEDSHITIMPCLSSLQIQNCNQLKTLPDFLRKTPLQTLDIKFSRILAQGCRKGRGKEWPKISHIPNIKIIPPLYSDFDDDGESIVEAKDAVELPERPSTFGDEGERIVEAEDDV